jgi:hypothetical protein
MHSPKERWERHIKKAMGRRSFRNPFHIAILKYGRKAFEVIILDEWDTKEEAWEGEAWNISQDKSHKIFGGYNSTWGESWIKDRYRKSLIPLDPTRWRRGTP